jgi:hypothetical protein
MTAAESANVRLVWATCRLLCKNLHQVGSSSRALSYGLMFLVSVSKTRASLRSSKSFVAVLSSHPLNAVQIGMKGAHL